MVRNGAALALGAAVFIACGSFAESTPPPATGSGDSGVDAGGPEGGADAPVAPVDAVAPLACPQGALVCEDFESGLGAWSASPSGVSLAQVPERGNVLLASLPAGGVAYAIIRKSFAPSSARLRLSFALRVADPKFTTEGSTANYAVAAMSISAGVGLSHVGFYLARGEGGATVHATIDAPSGFRGTSEVRMSYGEWHRVTVETHFADAGSLRYEVDGLEGGSVDVSSAIGPAELRLGLLRQNDATPALSVEMDDVFVEGL